MVGQVLGRYKIVEEIGAGGMGVVFRARDERLGRDLALKVLSPGALHDEVSRRRFRNEALMLSRLNHPSIQVIHDFDTQDGLDFLVSELVAGVTLNEKLRAGPLSEKQIVDLGLQLAQGLVAAHAAGVLHRDLKPSNLRVTPDGRLKILDFGLATLSQDAISVLSTMTSISEAPSGISGTVPYMSPEQLLGEKLDDRSDIYAAGAVLYEMSTGRMAFAEAVPTRLTNSILHQLPASPRSLNSKVSAELERIILKCLEKDPELRYQSAKELASDLKRLSLGGQTTGSAVMVPVGPKSHRLLSVLAGAIAIIIIIGLISVTMLRRKNTAANSSGPLQFEQITNFTDSASEPALSPDGKMVGFIRGADSLGSSANEGQVWVKLLPNGDPVQLTHSAFRKNAVTFSPDGSRVAYTQLNARFLWDTWGVPVLGGEPSQLLPNASGLTWIAPDRMMFSEVRPGEGVHMGIATSGPSRAEETAVYWPSAVTNMAHHSALSPDGKWALVVEMDGTGWLPCRVVPFDGSGAMRVVGPPHGACTAAKWSPDGNWMYFSCNAGGSFHLWRQEFPDGKPEQLTNGVTEEEGIAVSADGKSLITAVGIRESTVWIHNRNGDRQITSEGFSYLPTLSRDAGMVYYMKQTGSSRSYVSGELWATDVASGRQDRVLPGYIIAHYDISRDGRMVVFAVAEGGNTGIWIAPLDHRSAPRQLTSGGEYRALFTPEGDIIYMTNNEPRHLYRMKSDGSDNVPVMSDPILHLMSVSPDGEWAAMMVPSGRGEDVSVIAYSLHGRKPALICNTCIGGFGPARMNAPLASWSPDGKYLYISLQFFAIESQKTLVVPLKPASAPPLLTPRPDVKEQYFASLPGARLINQKDVFPGPDISTYAFYRRSSRTNLYRLRLP
jgi:eukaryotic-like serine/threonine-protein kinase